MKIKRFHASSLMERSEHNGKIPEWLWSASRSLVPWVRDERELRNCRNQPEHKQQQQKLQSMSTTISQPINWPTQHSPHAAKVRVQQLWRNFQKDGGAIHPWTGKSCLSNCAEANLIPHAILRMSGCAVDMLDLAGGSYGPQESEYWDGPRTSSTANATSLTPGGGRCNAKSWLKSWALAPLTGVSVSYVGSVGPLRHLPSCDGLLEKTWRALKFCIVWLRQVAACCVCVFYGSRSIQCGDRRTLFFPTRSDANYRYRVVLPEELLSLQRQFCGNVSRKWLIIDTDSPLSFSNYRLGARNKLVLLQVRLQRSP